MEGLVVVNQFFPISKAELWPLLTRLDLMRQWYFESIPEFMAQIGFYTRFNVDAGERQFMHIWKITDLAKESKMVIDWRYDGYEGISEVSFLLKDVNGGCELTVIHEGMESFPSEIPEFSKESCEEGWNYFIRKRLVNFVNRNKF